MQYLGVEVSLKNLPSLEKSFLPFGPWAEAFLRQADRPFSIAVEREDGKTTVLHTFLRAEGFAAANYRYAERTVKFLLWSVGGYRVWLQGDHTVIQKLKEAYSHTGERSFDVQFMEDVYERPFEMLEAEGAFPKRNEAAVSAGGHMEGYRIGFDAGGSDRKVSAVVDGVAVYSEEVVWHPKTQEDPTYQYEGILDSFRRAASKMPRVDAIGVSSAGVFVGNCPMVSSLFIRVPKSRREEVKSIFTRAAKQIGGVPLVVANDGDVTALAGAMSLEKGCVMGLAMGTSEAVGYVNEEGKLLGHLNELAFAPVDLFEDAMEDEWSGDRGVGCKYFSQDAVIKLAPRAGVYLSEDLTPAEKLLEVQRLAESGHLGAQQIFADIGCYLAHTLALYARFYDIRYLLVLGRVASGVGGERIVCRCKEVLREEYPELEKNMTVMLPDEKTRRVGQSVAAASLPELR